MPDYVVYLTVEQIIEMHDEALELFGGLQGLRSHDALYASVFQPQQSVFGEDAYSTIPEKAAAYAFFLAMNHPFVDAISEPLARPFSYS